MINLEKTGLKTGVALRQVKEAPALEGPFPSAAIVSLVLVPEDFHSVISLALEPEVVPHLPIPTTTLDLHPQIHRRYLSKPHLLTFRFAFLIIFSMCRQMFSGLGGMGGFSSMGNMGGGGARTHSHSMFQDDEMDGSFTSFGGMPGGMPSRHQTGGMPPRHQNGGMPSRHQPRQRPPSPPSPPSEITKPLKVSLQELYSGAIKKLKVGRRLLNGATEDKVLEIHIHPGWKSGTKIRFPHAGNDQPNADPQDLVFVVEEKQHEVFTREGNDLSCRVPISLVEALTGSPSGKIVKVVEMLDGRKLQVTVPSGIVKPGQETIISGEGMPIRKDGSVKRKGDLIVKWEVTFPERLSPAQQEGVRKVLG